MIRESLQSRNQDDFRIIHKAGADANKVDLVTETDRVGTRCIGRVSQQQQSVDGASAELMMVGMMLCECVVQKAEDIIMRLMKAELPSVGPSSRMTHENSFQGPLSPGC